MKAPSLALLLLLSIPAAAQSADAIYQQACGPKDTSFVVEQVTGQPSATPAPGKALVYIIQRESGFHFKTRVGMDGAWAGMVEGNSYIPLTVAPGEHHFCAASQDRKHPEAEFVHFTAEAGKVYYYLVHGSAADGSEGPALTMKFDVVDRDEALYLIASHLQSVAKPKP